MNRVRFAAVIAAAAVAAGAAGTAVALTAGGSSGPGSPRASAQPAGGAGGSSYTYYRSVMSRLYPASSPGSGSMMGGSSNGMTGGSSNGPYGWMMGEAGYQWMMGEAAAPAWMRGSALPGFMMGTSHDPGKVMGRLWADAPGPRVTPAQAARLGNQVPAGATIDRAANRITFPGTAANMTVLASPAGSPDETFRIAGLANPAITVARGAQVSIEVVNADPDTAHGLVITAAGAAFSWMPMMTAVPAFSGSALWFLGNPTSAGMHAATLTFTAATPGHYTYLCPVPGHAEKGMAGAFTVSGT